MARGFARPLELLVRKVKAFLRERIETATTASGVVAALKAAIAAANFTGVLDATTTAPERLTVALLLREMVGEALAVVVA